MPDAVQGTGRRDKSVADIQDTVYEIVLSKEDEFS
jgi:hypothetical protein